MRHLIALAAGVALMSAPSRAQTVIWSDSFENGLSNWTATNSPSGCSQGCQGFCGCVGNWEILGPTTPCFNMVGNVPDGSHVAWFGILGNCNYDGGPGFASDSLLELNTPVPLPTGAGTLILRFWTKSMCEPSLGYDARVVYAFTPNPGQATSLPYLPNSDWVERVIDVTAFAGQPLYVWFRFVTNDDMENAYPGWFIDDVRVESLPDPSTHFCAGDGTATVCPCSVSGAPGHGCPSGQSALGSELSASGSPQVSADSIVLRAGGVQFTSVLFFQGTTQVAGGQGVIFGDGLRCVGGSIVRLGITVGDSQFAQYPTAGAPSVSARGGVPGGGGTRMYQAWYRDFSVSGYCTPSQFNLTNGLQLNWVP